MSRTLRWEIWGLSFAVPHSDIPYEYSKYVYFVFLLSETWKVFGEMEELG